MLAWVAQMDAPSPCPQFLPLPGSAVCRVPVEAPFLWCLPLAGVVRGALDPAAADMSISSGYRFEPETFLVIFVSYHQLKTLYILNRKVFA